LDTRFLWWKRGRRRSSSEVLTENAGGARQRIDSAGTAAETPASPGLPLLRTRRPSMSFTPRNTFLKRGQYVRHPERRSAASTTCSDAEAVMTTAHPPSLPPMPPHPLPLRPTPTPP